MLHPAGGADDLSVPGSVAGTFGADCDHRWRKNGQFRDDRQARGGLRAMTSIRSIFAFVLSSILCTGASVIAAGPAPAQTAPLVRVATPLVETVKDWDEYTGRFQAAERVVLQARVSGYLSGIFFEGGELVAAGDLLFEIDPRPFRAALAQAEAQLAAALAQRDLAEIELGRAEELFERNAGPESNAQRRRAELQVALADVALHEARIASARLDLEFTKIYAPISGRISDTEIDVGNLVIGGPTAATELANIVSVDPIEFVFTVSEADFLKYARLSADGSRVSSRDTENVVYVRLMDETVWTRQGRMTFVDNQLDPNSGALLGRATLANADMFLQPGGFGRLRLPGSGPYEALLVPDAAIVADQSSQLVYVVGDDDVVAPRLVETGPLYRGLRVIRSGLGRDERVIVSGVQRARPGATVAPTPIDLAFATAAD